MNKIALSSLAMDLKRVALGFYRDSPNVANRFLEEALKRKEEIDIKTVKPYVKDLLEKLNQITKQKNYEKVAEDILLYSILFQNAALKA
ncbi:MAG: hypothetical protein M1450_03350 [Patescibacteria group bacterium]|nr:hypothetical protein [Patescibacteria group bacterium]